MLPNDPFGAAPPPLQADSLTIGPARTAIARTPPFVLRACTTALVCGPSGCGKTTLLFTLAGLLSPLSGAVRISGDPFSALPSRGRSQVRANKIGLVFQDVHLVERLSVIENVLLGVFASGMRADRARALELLDRVGIGELAGRDAGTLSRGEGQRVALARALIARPAVLLADEPTASLDDKGAVLVADLFEQAARETRAALLIATHDARLMARFPERVLLEPCT